jgi:predicted  nucleic acid-binding Zn-ribbon protein
MPEATDADLQKLLELQAEDSAIKRLNERRESLPEAARLAELQAQLAELNSDLAIATKRNEEINREYSRFEGEIELVEQKIKREEERMFSGNVSNPKELGSLQAEVASLRKKQAGLEDELLEVMEQREGSSDTVVSLTSERDSIAQESERLTETVKQLTSDIDAELATHTEQRTTIETGIPADLLKLYDTIRSQKQGVGAAALEGGTCQGCHTRLPQSELERIKQEGGLQRCDNCRRILITV